MGKRRFHQKHVAKQSPLSYLASFFTPKQASWVLVPSLEKKNESLNRIFSFKLAPNGVSMPAYVAGQYVLLSFPDYPILGSPRPFYIASSPYDSRYLEFFGKDNDEWTLQAKLLSESAGTGSQMVRVRVDGPYGQFSLRDKATEGSHIFLAAGMGAVPFFSILESLAFDKPKLRILFLWGARKRDELFALEDLKQIAAKMPGLHFIPVLSHDPLWTGERGRIDEDKLTRLLGSEWDSSSCWISGPPQFCSTMQKIIGRLSK